MNHLEFRFKLDGYPTLEPAAGVVLMDQEGVEPIPVERAEQMLERVGWSRRYVVDVRFQQAAVFITPEWAVLVIGQSLLHCVSVLCELLKLIEAVLETHVTITLVTSLDKPLVSLYGFLAEHERLLIALKIAGIVTTLVLSGFVGVSIDRWIWPLLFGGQSQ